MIWLINWKFVRKRYLSWIISANLVLSHTVLCVGGGAVNHCWHYLLGFITLRIHSVLDLADLWLDWYDHTIYSSSVSLFMDKISNDFIFGFNLRSTDIKLLYCCRCCCCFWASTKILCRFLPFIFVYFGFVSVTMRIDIYIYLYILSKFKVYVLAFHSVNLKSSLSSYKAKTN